MMRTRHGRYVNRPQTLVQAALRIPILSVIGILLWFATAPASADSVRCRIPEFIVVDADPQYAELVCDTVTDTVYYMERYGFRATRPETRVHIVDTLVQTHFVSSLGSYDAKHDRIEILSYEAALKVLPHRPAFGIKMSPELYRSFVAHEIAHAIANVNFARPPVVSAHEYIAYTVQLATMPESLRAAIIRNVDTEGFDHPKEVDEMLLAVDPNLFAVKSYLHFARPQNGALAFEQLLTGQF